MLRQQTFFNIYEPKISIYDINASQWSFYCLTFKCDVDFQLTWTNVSNEQLCQIILKSMHKCRSYGLKKLNLWPFYHFFWPSSVTLTFNIPEHMFQMALLLLRENNCAKLFWNPCINVDIHVIARTSSIYDHFIFWSSSVTLTFNLSKQVFRMSICAK